MGSRRRGPLVAVALLAVLSTVIACGSDDPESIGSTDGQEAVGSTEASPFSVGYVPDGYHPIQAGRGEIEGDWGQDCCGTDEPYTVLTLDGAPDGAGPVVVSVTGYEGYQGGLFQASGAYPTGPERVDADGAEALHVPEGPVDDGDRSTWPELLVDRGDDRAVRVSGPGLDLDQLLAIAREAELPEHRTDAPLIPEPPFGLEVVGSVDVAGVVAKSSGGTSYRGGIYAPVGSWVTNWAGGGALEMLTVLTLPGNALDLDALLVDLQPRVSSFRDSSSPAEVGGRAAVVTERERDEEETTVRSVWTTTSWGDVVVVSSYAVDPIGTDDLLRMAGSVEATDAGAWEVFIRDVVVGPRLAPDADRSEVTRGVVGDREWLLQTSATPGDEPYLAGLGPPGIDPCVKLSDGTRRCAINGGDGPGYEWAQARPSPGQPEWDEEMVVVATSIDAAAVRFVTPTESVDAPLAPVPGTDWSATVVLVGDPYAARCDFTQPDGTTETGTFLLLDSEGNPTACV